MQLNNRKENSKQQDQNTHLGLSTSNNSIANTPQDYINNVKSFPSRSPSQGDEEDSALILTQDNLKSSDPDLSAISDQESGVEDLNCRSPSGGCLPSEDSGKDSDEAVLVTVWNDICSSDEEQGLSLNILKKKIPKKRSCAIVYVKVRAEQALNSYNKTQC